MLRAARCSRAAYVVCDAASGGGGEEATKLTSVPVPLSAEVAKFAAEYWPSKVSDA